MTVKEELINMLVNYEGHTEKQAKPGTKLNVMFKMQR
jgi:hypothetical protein